MKIKKDIYIDLKINLILKFKLLKQTIVMNHMV